MSCPICKRSVKKSDSDFPFCSERCRTIDLGNWASEKYVISSPITSQRDPREFPEGEFPESHDED